VSTHKEALLFLHSRSKLTFTTITTFLGDYEDTKNDSRYDYDTIDIPWDRDPEKMDYDSPALSVNSDMTDEELDRYFATYVPLSNLPTPPPAKERQPAASSQPSQPSSTSAPEHQGTIISS
jgi:hypothetical protein